MLSLREVIALILLALPLLVTVSAIEAADWVKGLPSLKAIVLMSLVAWAYLARSAVPWWVGHPVAFLVGLIVAFVLGAVTISESRGLGDLASQLGTWFGAIGSQDGHRGTSMTGVALIAITLWMGHATVWLAYRRSFALLAVLPGLGVLLVVLTYLPSDYYWYFFMYLLAVAPGIAYRHNGRWNIRGQRAPLFGALAAGLMLMSATVAAVWQSPAPDGVVIPLVSKFDKPWYSFREAWSNLFHGVPNRKELPFFSPPHDLPFTGPIEPGDDVLFVVESQRPYRWRMRLYETYTGNGWVSEEAPVEKVSMEVSLRKYMESLKARKEVEIDVRIYSKASTLVSVGEPLAADLSYKVELSPPPNFKLYLEGSQMSYLPIDVQVYRSQLSYSWVTSSSQDKTLASAIVRKAGQTLKKDPEAWMSSPGDSHSPLPPLVQLRDMGYRMVPTVETSANKTGQQPQQSEKPHVVITRLQSVSQPPLALLGQRILVPPREYRTVGSTSLATPGMLRKAGQDYPDWITDRYLQLPNEFPMSVRTLSIELTKDADNPYDMVEAIRHYLLSLPYSLDITLPPPGQDWVEYFLLVQRRGYCQNYASAMVTMLRSLGIPARLVVGFAPGIWEPDRGVWVVRSRDYHAWPEVYFPGYGWIEFEPTPADVQPALQALGIQPLGGLLSASPEFGECLDAFAFEGCFEGSVFNSGIDDFLVGPVDPEGSASDAGGSGGGGLSTLSWALMGLALALVTSGGFALYVRQALAHLGAVTTTYASMCFMGRLAGVSLKPQDTPWEYCSRLSRDLPEHAEAIAHITQGFVATRYGGPHSRLDSDEIGSMRSAWRSARLALLGRILLRLLPRRQRPTL